MDKHQSSISLGSFIGSLVSSAIFFPALIMLSAGSFTWIEGWLFSLWFDAMVLSTMIYMYLKNPGLLVERAKFPGSDGQKKWDVFLLVFIYFLSIFWLMIMPLDAKRFNWSPIFPLWLKIIGGLLLIPAIYLIYRTTTENSFLSARVRIQEDRSQKLIDTGLYSIVRHPLYLGCLLMLAGAPLLVGSIWGLWISLVGLITLVFRILGEEKMLVNELVGYADYQKRVRFRLIPFVW